MEKRKAGLSLGECSTPKMRRLQMASSLERASIESFYENAIPDDEVIPFADAPEVPTDFTAMAAAKKQKEIEELPVEPPLYFYDTPSPFDGAFCGSPNRPLRFGRIIRKIWGTHIVCEYTMEIIHQDSGLPIRKDAAGKRTVVVKLPLLERLVKKRPKAGMESVACFLSQVETEPEWKPIEENIPQHPSKSIYHSGRWIVYDYRRKVSCRRCEREMKSLNGKSCTSVDTFRFRACCYPRPSFKLMNPKATTHFKRILSITYDLETTPTTEGIHELFMGIAVLDPELERVLGNTVGYTRFSTAEEFMSLIESCISAIHDRQYFEQDIPTSLQLVSFNGSRYDDLFLVKAWREFVYQRYGRQMLDLVEYSERGGALTFNTLVLSRDEYDLPLFEVRWTDVARFVPPTSLKNLAKSFKLSEEKGTMPFKALNDFIRKGANSVQRDDDGFLSLTAYYGNNKQLRNESYEYYKQVVPVESRVPSKDIDILCEQYCLQDVKVTKAAYDLLNNLYSTYLYDQAVLSPFGTKNFQPMTLHSMATMAGKVLTASAAGSPVWGWNSITKEATTSVSAGTAEPQTKWGLYAPIGPSYDYCRQAIVGGWVKGYYQGLILDDKYLPTNAKKSLDILKRRHDVKIEHNVGHGMTDIASMYPVAVTYPMPLGHGYFVEIKEERNARIMEVLEEPDPLKIHKFFFRAKWTAPTRPLFSESTLPQRQDRSNSLRWTYMDDHSGVRVYTSLDLWIAGRDHINAGSDTIWKVHDCSDMLMFDCSAQIYRPFMEACTKLKMDGAAEGNELKRSAGKIAMNAGIGKLGQQVDARINTLGSDNAAAVVLKYGESARLVHAEKISLNGAGKQPHLDEVEYSFRNKDAWKNRWPVTHAAFMYSATRLMRYNWSLLANTNPTRQSIYLLKRPTSWYGDTDSKILTSEQTSAMPSWFIGNQVGQFKPENPPGLDSRPFFQVEPEDVSKPPYVPTISGILGSKKYFVWSANMENVDSRQGKLKFKCNGLTRFSAEKNTCPLHNIPLCVDCRCEHDIYVFECVPCSLDLLASEQYDDDNINLVSSGPDSPKKYKYDCHALQSLTVLDFLRVLITGKCCRTSKEAFTRNLSVSTSKLPSFTVKTFDQTRTLSRPQLLDKEHAKKDIPPTTQPFVSGCVQLDSNSGVLFPTGQYLYP